MWSLWQFERTVSDFCRDADSDTWEAVEDRLDTLMRLGTAARMPVSEPLGDGLFALRARAGTKQPRLLYFFRAGRQIIFVHAVSLKKRRTIHPDDIAMARRKKGLVERNLGQIHGFTVESNS
jgi:hypothetical protein